MSVTDASGDLWKSLRMRFEGFANNTIQSDAAVYLITTGAAPMDGAAWFLRSNGGRDVKKALQKLETVTQTSDSEANAPALEAFLAVMTAARRVGLDNVMVFARAPSVPTIDDYLKAKVHWFAEMKHFNAFLQRLEGWWLRRSVKQLTAAPQAAGAAGLWAVRAERQPYRRPCRPPTSPFKNGPPGKSTSICAMFSACAPHRKQCSLTQFWFL